MSIGLYTALFETSLSGKVSLQRRLKGGYERGFIYVPEDVGSHFIGPGSDHVIVYI